jgi:ATPase
MQTEKLVPDTSVIIEGSLCHKLSKNELQPRQVLIHEAVLAELEHQANQGKSIGLIGIDELKKLKVIAKEKDVEILFAGRRPTSQEIRYAKLGEIDALIRQLAFDEGATLLTSDKVQGKIAEARDIPVIFVVPKKKAEKKLLVDKYFDETTMSVHLKENVMPFVKRGKPGQWRFVAVDKKLLTQDMVKAMGREMIEESRLRADGFIEIEREGSTILQLGSFRTVITKPPFSDGWEMTVVRPVKKLSLEHYKLSEKLKQRIAEKAEGILIAGSPGNGKSTFAQALAEFYSTKGKIVKTIEAPRDMILPDAVTQFSKARAAKHEIHDVLLLSRPDYSMFDEMRDTDDFELFVDLRLAGIGLAGVVHAKRPVDAIQRFVGRIELGVIPQVVDTVVFIENGEVHKVLSLTMHVKVPSGMTEADLARPVVVINDFETDKPLFEIYTYGEQTVVMPYQKTEQKGGVHKLAGVAIERALQRYASVVRAEVISDSKATVFVPERSIARLIGAQGKTIMMLEKELGIKLDVRALEDVPTNKPAGKSVDFGTHVSKKNVEFLLDDHFKGKDADIYVNTKLLVTLNVGAKGKIKVKRQNPFGKALLDALQHGDDIEVRI